VVRREIASAKIARASAWLNDAERLLGRPLAELSADVAGRDLAAFYLLLAIQECVDLGAHWIADAGWSTPAEVGSTFDVLAERGAIERPLADEMRAAVRVRNRIAHGYASVDHARLHAEAPAGIATMRRFLLAAAAAAGL
jgi:uncharacterized protein YutE (UPF0331/DUF86 family)